MNAESLAAAAQAWANAGAAIFPLQPGTKRPYSNTRGFHAARPDASPWADGTPHNIGFVPASLGLIAIDVDKPEHWADAQHWGLLAQPTFEVQTPNGRHFYFRGAAPSNGCPVDSLIVRAAHGYTILPPSRTDAGTYECTGDLSDALPLPAAFAERLAQAASRGGARDRVARVFTARQIAEGERHGALCTLAGHLASRGIEELHGLELVHAWNAQYCIPPKDAREVTRLVSDIYRKERKSHAATVAGLLSASPAQSGPKAPVTRPGRESKQAMRRRILGGR